MAASRIPNPLGQGSSPWGYANKMRGWYSGCALAFQASETSSILVPRSIFIESEVYHETHRY